MTGRNAQRVIDAIARLGTSSPIVLIDGPSGAGKSTLADAVLAAWPAVPGPGPEADGRAPSRPELLRLDDIYPGWGGLAAASRHIVEELLGPLRRAGAGRWRAWDWAAGRSGAWHEVAAGHPLVIEGCGALSRPAAPLADLTVWLDADDAVRKRRALARDRGAFDSHWEMWDEQFVRFVGAEHPISLASLVLDADGAAKA